MSLFDKPKHKDIAKIIRISSPSAARESVSKLRQKFNHSGHEERVVILRSSVLAANRAEAFLHRKHLSSEERGQMRRVAETYRPFARSIRRRL